MIFEVENHFPGSHLHFSWTQFHGAPAILIAILGTKRKLGKCPSWYYSVLLRWYQRPETVVATEKGNAEVRFGLDCHSGKTANSFYLWSVTSEFMRAVAFPFIVQICLAFGMAGLLWPEKVKPVFELLMFPWFPTYRTLRIHSIGALALSALLVLAWVVSGY